MASTITKSQLRQMIKEAVLKEQLVKTGNGGVLVPFDVFWSAKSLFKLFDNDDLEPFDQGGHPRGQAEKDRAIAEAKEYLLTISKFINDLENEDYFG